MTKIGEIAASSYQREEERKREKKGQTIAGNWPDFKANRSSDVERSRTTVALVRGSSQIENQYDWAHTSGLRTDNWPPNPCAWVACPRNSGLQNLFLSSCLILRLSSGRVWYSSTPNCLTFVKTTAIAYGQKMGRSLKILVLCNSSRFYKRQAIGSTRVVRLPKATTRVLSEVYSSGYLSTGAHCVRH